MINSFNSNEPFHVELSSTDDSSKCIDELITKIEHLKSIIRFENCENFLRENFITSYERLLRKLRINGDDIESLDDIKIDFALIIFNANINLSLSADDSDKRERFLELLDEIIKL